MLRVCCYMRMSTDRQEYSIESQWHMIESYCSRNDMKVVRKYVDEGISGGYAKLSRRVSFLQMIQDSTDADWEAVVIYDSSRFSRSFEQAVAYRAELERNGKRVVSVTEPDVEGEGGKYLNAIRAIGNEEYLLRLSKSVRRGQKEKIERGELFCKPPYGYRKEGNNFIIIPEEADVVRMVYERFKSGSSAYQIAKECFAAGIKTHRGNGFDSRQIERILLNPAYMGTLHVIASGVEYSIPDKIPPIISKEEWDQIQELFRHFKLTHKKKQRPRELGQHWLCGHIRCSTCGGAYTRSGCRHAGSTHVYYAWRCTNRLRANCGQKTIISEPKITELFCSALRNLIEGIDDTYKQISFAPARKLPEVDFDSQIARLQKQLKRCKEAYEAEIDTLEEYAANKRRIMSDIEFLKTQKVQKDTAPMITPEVQKIYSDIYSLLLDEQLPTVQKRSAVDRILDRIIIYPDHTVSIIFLSPADVQ